MLGIGSTEEDLSDDGHLFSRDTSLEGGKINPRDLVEKKSKYHEFRVD